MKSETRGRALVTGATGLVGRWLITELSRDGWEVLAPVRRAAERGAELAAWVGAHGGDARRIRVVEGDLAKDGLGLDTEARAAALGSRLVLHLGAAMAMGLDATVAHETNVRGAERMIELARRMPSLQRFVLLSGFRTAVATPEAAVGAYERSKIVAHRRVVELAREHRLPLTLVNPSTVIGDSRTGETTLMWGFADMVSDIRHRRLEAVPGCGRVWMPLISVDYLAQFLARVPVMETEPLTEHFVLDDATPTIRGLVERIATRVGAPPPRLSVPLSVARLASRVRGRADQAEMLSFLGPERYDVSSADAAAQRAGLHKPDIGEVIDRSVDYLASVRPAVRAA